MKGSASSVLVGRAPGFWGRRPSLTSEQRAERSHSPMPMNPSSSPSMARFTTTGSSARTWRTLTTSRPRPTAKSSSPWCVRPGERALPHYRPLRREGGTSCF